MAPNRSSGVATPRLARPANTAVTRRIEKLAPNNSLRASTRSVRAPAGTVNRNNGRLVAVCTSETVIGSGLILAMNQPLAASNIAIPRLEIVLAPQMIVNATLANAPQREPASCSPESSGASPT